MVDNVLGLNADHLIESRKLAMEQLWQQYLKAKSKSRGLSAIQRQRLADNQRAIANRNETEYPTCYLSLAQHIAKSRSR